MSDLTIQAPWRQDATLAAVKRAGSEISSGYLKAAYAYASTGGVQLATDALADTVPGWEKMRKQWLVSFDWGTTAPEAIEMLMTLPGSSVRIPNGDDVLRRRLIPRQCFHPKMVILHKSPLPELNPAALVHGSGNLTVAGLMTNYESCAVEVARRKGPGAEFIAQCLLDLQRAWREADEPTADLLQRYRELRRRRPVASEDALPEPREVEKAEVEQTFDRIAALATATHLWVNAGYVVRNLGGGRPGNQIDLARGTRAFFGFSGRRVERNTMLGPVRVRYGTKVTSTNMRFANNSMDRLNLPIPGESGPDAYEDEWLGFERRSDGTFEMTVLDRRGLADARRRSRVQGTLFKMRSGREYGVYRV